MDIPGNPVGTIRPGIADPPTSYNIIVLGSINSPDVSRVAYLLIIDPSGRGGFFSGRRGEPYAAPLHHWLSGWQTRIYCRHLASFSIFLLPLHPNITIAPTPFAARVWCTEKDVEAHACNDWPFNSRSKHTKNQSFRLFGSSHEQLARLDLSFPMTAQVEGRGRDSCTRGSAPSVKAHQGEEGGAPLREGSRRRDSPVQSRGSGWRRKKRYDRISQPFA